MNNATIHDTIGAIAVSMPESVPVFTSHGLDFCCGGTRTLQQACDAAGLEPNAVLREIQDATSRAGASAREDWLSLGISALADHIERVHHARARDLIGRVEVLMPRVLAAHGDMHPNLRAVAERFASFRDELSDHMVREERVLFPWLRRLDTPHAVHIGPPWSVARPIACMIHDHNDAAAALARIRSELQDYTVPPEACRIFAALITALRELDEDTRVHIHKENNALFPAGIHAEAARGANRAPPSPDAASCESRRPVHSGD